MEAIIEFFRRLWRGKDVKPKGIYIDPAFALKIYLRAIEEGEVLESLLRDKIVMYEVNDPYYLVIQIKNIAVAHSFELLRDPNFIKNHIEFSVVMDDEEDSNHEVE